MPFHYFGTEISVDGEVLGDNNKLVCEQRIYHIINDVMKKVEQKIK